MTYNIYSVQDVKTSFAQPFVDSTNESATRGFLYAFSRNDSIMRFSPSDFRLFRIGTFNADTGEIVGCIPEFVVDASQYDKVGDSDA